MLRQLVCLITANSGSSKICLHTSLVGEFSATTDLDFGGKILINEIYNHSYKISNDETGAVGFSYLCSRSLVLSFSLDICPSFSSSSVVVFRKNNTFLLIVCKKNLTKFTLHYRGISYLSLYLKHSSF